MTRIITTCICLILCAAPLIGQETKQFNATADEVSKITIDVTDKQIHLKTTEEKTIRIEYQESETASYAIQIIDGHLMIKDQYNKTWKNYFGRKPSLETRVLTVYIPNDHIQQLAIDTTNESITLQPVTIKESVSLVSNGGDIIFDKLTVGRDIILKAKNSDITGTLLGRYDDYNISSTIKKGTSNLPKLKATGTKRLIVSNNNGDIEIEFITQE